MTGVDNLSSSENELRVRDVIFILCRSFLVAAAIFVLCVLVFPPCYGAIDDVHLTMIVSGVGVCPRPDYHILFPHIWLGQLLSWLYSAQSSVPWYGLLLSLANVFSYSLVLSVFAWERPSALRKALVGLFTLVSMVALWTSLTFTSTAIFLGAASTVVAMSALENKNLGSSSRVLVLIISALAMCFAGLIRVDSARLMVLLLGVFLCCRFAFSRSTAKLFFGLALSAVFFTAIQVQNYVDNSCYASEPGWSYFFRLNKSINKICDFRRLAYRSDTKKYFDTVGWDENDLNVMMAYEFAIDSKLYSCENAEKVLSFFPIFRSDLSLPMVLEHSGKYIATKLVLPSLLLAILLFPFLDNTRLSRTRLSFVSMGFLGVLLYLLCCMKLEIRITLPLFAWLALVAVYHCDDERLLQRLRLSPKHAPRQLAVCAGSIAVALLTACVGYWQYSAEAASARLQLKSSCIALQRLNGSLYVIPSTVPLGLVSPFENARDYFSSMRILIPYLAATPLVDSLVDKETQKETRIPFLEPGVLLCTTDTSRRFKSYYLDHRNKNVVFKPCFADELIKVYRAELAESAPKN